MRNRIGSRALAGTLALGMAVAFAASAAAASSAVWSPQGELPLALQDRIGMAETYDPATGEVLLFGGESATTYTTYNDLWGWTPQGGWRLLVPNGSAGPAKRMLAAMAYDPVTGKVVLTSGFAQGANTSYQDTWTWSPTDPGDGWSVAPNPSRLQIPTLSIMAGEPLMVYDPTLIGGGGLVFLVSAGSSGPQTWIWTDSTGWEPDLNAQIPENLMFPSIAYVPTGQGAVLVYGGLTTVPGTASNTLWQMDNTGQWTGVPLPAPGPDNVGGSMVYDPATAQTLLFGGSGGYASAPTNALYSLTVLGWQPLNVGAPPPARLLPTWAFDPAANEAVLVGGSSGPFTTQALPLNDTWTYGPFLAPPKAMAPLQFLDIATAATTSDPQGTSVSQPTGKVGQFFFEVLHSAGGTGFGDWHLASGKLPPGLALDVSGALIGTPTAAGTYTFTAEVVDLAGASVQHHLTVTIQPAN